MSSSSSRPPDIFSMSELHHFLASSASFFPTSGPLLNYQEPYFHALFFLPSFTIFIFSSIFSIRLFSSPLLISTALCGITGSVHGFFFLFFIVVENEVWKMDLFKRYVKCMHSVIHYTRHEFLQHSKVSSSPFAFMEDCDNVFFLLQDKPCLFIFFHISF